MARKTRKQEIAEFFKKCDLYMPPAIPAREAIHYYVHKGNSFGGMTSAERIVFLRRFAACWNGRLVRHRMDADNPSLHRIRYVLPKTEHEIWKARINRAQSKLDDLGEVSLFKACVRDVRTGRSQVIFLDMLVEVWPS